MKIPKKKLNERQKVLRAEKRNKKRLKKEADKEWFIKCLKPLCEVCGSLARQVHHFFPKGLYPELRLNPKNGISLCMACHFKHHHLGDPLIYQAIIEKRGNEWLNYLKKQIK